MYISGNVSDYAVRLNQLPTSGLDLDKFELEGYTYTGQWKISGSKFANQRLLAKKATSIIRSGYLPAQMFTGTNYF